MSAACRRAGRRPSVSRPLGDGRLYVAGREFVANDCPNQMEVDAKTEHDENVIMPPSRLEEPHDSKPIAQRIEMTAKNRALPTANGEIIFRDQAPKRCVADEMNTVPEPTAIVRAEASIGRGTPIV